MTVSTLANASNYQALGAQAAQNVTHHRHGGHHAKSISDVDAQGSSIASSPSVTGKIGSKLDITV